MKKIYWILPLVLLSSCTIGMSKEDRFINATAEIACVYHPTETSTSTISSLEEQQSKNKALQQMIENIAIKYNFKNSKELDELSQQYKLNSTIIKKTQDKINTICPTRSEK